MAKISELSDGGSLLPTDYLIAVRSGGNVKVQADTINVDQIDLGDNERIRLGASQDLQIYHDGSNSIVADVGAGGLFLSGSSYVAILNGDRSEYMLNANVNGEVGIYYDNSKKLATTSTGIDVTGGITTTSSVGIGTTSPSQLLHVSQGTNATATTIRIENTDTTIDAAQTANAIEFYTNDASTGGTGVTGKISHVAVNAGSTYALTFSSYDGSSLSERMRIDEDGNVGIGVLNPAYKLDVTDSTNASISALRTGASRIVISAEASNESRIEARGATSGSTLTFYTGASAGATTERLRIDSSGNVGIGTTTPDNKFHVVSGAAGEVAQFTGAIETRGLSIRSETNTDASAHVVFNSQSGGSKGMFTFETDGAERVRIDSSGNVGIGTTAPGRLLELKESSTGAGDAIIRLRGHGNEANNTPLGSLEWFNTDPSGDQPGVVAAIEAQSDNASGHMGKLLFKTHDGAEGGEGSSPVERMRIDSSGNVGIRSDSPESQLHIYQPSGQTGFYVTRSPTIAGGPAVGITADSTKGRIYGYGDSLSFWTAVSGGTAAEAMRIDSSGNVGIGTTNPLKELHIASSQPEIRLEDTGGTVNYGDIVYTDGRLIISADGGNAQANSTIEFQVDGTEYMRIDSGNLLVGSTSFNKDVNGVYSGNDGLFYATATPGATEFVTSFNRKSTDGGIIRLQKDGASVGGIGTSANDLTIYSSTAGHNGLRFHLNGILPTDNTGAIINDDADLGDPNYRFKDLWLSSGVYIGGGTAEANKLDYYEEGTWTPAFSGATGGITYNSQTGYYTIIGNIAIVQFHMNISVTTVTGSNLNIAFPAAVNPIGSTITKFHGGTLTQTTGLNLTEQQKSNLVIASYLAGTAFYFYDNGTASVYNGTTLPQTGEIAGTVIYTLA